MTPLPIDPLLGEIARIVREKRVLVLEAPPGAGKTTRVPRALLEDANANGPANSACEIVVLEPRRLAARMAARRVAEELGERVGETVGYQVRFEDVSSARTRIRFVTEGILTRKLLSDPTLKNVSAVILDEFHERHLHGDVALALLRRLRESARPDLALIAMSATLDAEPVARYLGAERIRSEGRHHPVDIEYAAADDRPLALQVVSAVRKFTQTTSGDILVFLPGAGEIRRVDEACANLASQQNLLVVPLHGDLSPDEQDRAVRRADRRKVILATNVAESSVTIEGVTAVVDSGLVRIAAHAPWSGLPTLKVARISRASAIQRAGRAGRLQPGHCLRLYTKGDFDTRPEHESPEVARADLTQMILELRASNVRMLEWFDAPPKASIDAAEQLLLRLGAIDSEGEITRIGRKMASFAVHPRQSRVLLEAQTRGVAADGCALAALLNERDIRRSERARFDGSSRGHDIASHSSDLIVMLDLLHEASSVDFKPNALSRIGLDVGTTLAVERARKQLAGQLRGATNEKTGDEAEEALLASTLAGFPDRVAKRVRRGGRALALAGGGSAELAETSAVRDAEWLVLADAELRADKIVVRLASAIEPTHLIDLFPERIVERTVVEFDESSERVLARDQMLFDGLVLNDSPSTQSSSEEIARVLESKAIRKGPLAFVSESFLRFLVRARFAEKAGAKIHLPDESELQAIFREICEGKSSFAELRDGSFESFIRTKIGSRECASVDAFTPERIELTSGRSVAIQYEDGKPPWIETYLQDFFGMRASPTVANGRVALVMHLWAPNRRPVQVTSDLEGFWVRHYPSIRKELMRKYPKHSWPEDPTVPTPRMRHGHKPR